MATSTATSAAALQELNALQAEMVRASSAAKATGARLQSLQGTNKALEAKIASLQAQVSAAKGTGGLAGICGKSARQASERLELRASRSKRRGFAAGLSGSSAGAWVGGEYNKIGQYAAQGSWSAMLQSAMRVAFTDPGDPTYALLNASDTAAVDAVLQQALESSPKLEGEARAALANMAAAERGNKTTDVVFDQKEYDAAAAGDLAYIAANKPNANFITQALTQTGQAVATLDKYVPGWTYMLDAVAPVLPGAGLLLEALAKLPGAGTIASDVASNLPLMGGGGRGYAPTNIATDAASGTPQFQSVPGVTSAVQTVSGTAGAVSFTLSKSAAQSAQQGAGVLEALTNVAQDLIDSYAFAAQFLVFTPAGAIGAALSAGIQALKSSVTLVRVLQAEAALQKAADAQIKAGLAQQQQDEAQINALLAQLAAINAETRALQNTPGPGSPTPAGTGSGPGTLLLLLAAGLVLAEAA